MCRMGVECVHLVQNRDTGWVHVKTLMNTWIPPDSRNFLTTGRSVSFSRRNCSMKLDCKTSCHLHVHPPDVDHIYKTFPTDAIYTLQLTVSS